MGMAIAGVRMLGAVETLMSIAYLFLACVICGIVGGAIGFVIGQLLLLPDRLRTADRLEQCNALVGWLYRETAPFAGQNRSLDCARIDAQAYLEGNDGLA